jgi:phage-related protein
MKESSSLALFGFIRAYPQLDISRCGDGMELRIEHPAIGKKGWLRAIFWIDEKAKTVYIVDLFWKKTNAISTADKLRANHRIRALKARLAKGEKPWSSLTSGP